MKRVIIIIIVALIALPTFAQKGKMHEQIQSAKIAFFTTELELTPDEAQSFWPLYNKYWKEAQDSHRNSMIALGGIRKITSADNATEAQMKEAADKYVNSLTVETSVLKSYMPQFYKILPAEKVAKLLVAEENFRHKLTKMWKEQKPSPQEPSK